MFCRKCGKEVKQGAKFCVKCGTPISGDAPLSQNVGTSVEIKKTQNVPDTQANEKKKSGKGLIIALLCVLVILIGVVAALLIYYITQGAGERNAQWEVEEVQERDADADDEDTDDEDTGDADIEHGDTEDTAVMEVTESTEASVAAQDADMSMEVSHTYQIVVADVSWTEAYSQARNVENGYLVNIDSQEEWDIIMQLINEQGYSDKIFWIGAMRKGSSDEYYWIDRDGGSVGGSLNASSHWLTGEPTYYDAENQIDERYVEMFYSSSLSQWVWNDTPDDLLSIVPYYSGKIAYIIEIEGVTN